MKPLESSIKKIKTEYHVSTQKRQFIMLYNTKKIIDDMFLSCLDFYEVHYFKHGDI